MVVPIAKYGSLLDLADHLDFDGRSLTDTHMALVLLQVAHAVLHLNAMHVNHGDVSARNVLVFEFNPDRPLQTCVMLADLGDARPGASPPDCIGALARELRGLMLQ